jgi:hypothetical protein
MSLVQQYYKCMSSTYVLLCSLHKLPGELYSWLHQVSTLSVLGFTSSSARGRGKRGTILTMMMHSPTATQNVTLRRTVWCCRPQNTDLSVVIARHCVTLQHICGTLHILRMPHEWCMLPTSKRWTQFQEVCLTYFKLMQVTHKPHSYGSMT